MKVKVTATVTLETEVHLDDYADVEGEPIRTEDDVLRFERLQIEDNNSGLVESLWEAGEFSNIKIEKIEEKAEAA